MSPVTHLSEPLSSSSPAVSPGGARSTKMPGDMAALSSPALSVFLPVYNGARYLRAAIDSILGQTFTDFELIAVDDGSSDASLEILQGYARRDPRVRVLSRPNTGVSGASNDAIAVARAPLIARMDADDIALPQRFEKQIAYLEEHPEVVLLGTRVLLVDPYDSPVYESDHATAHEAITQQLLGGVGWAVCQPTSMMRLAAVRQVGLYRRDRVPSEDLEMFLRLSEIGQIANLPEVLLRYRQHLGSANHTRWREQNQLKGLIVQEAHARRGLPLPPGWTPPQRNVVSTERELDIWGWTALKHGNTAVARKHALALIRRKPASRNAWKLLLCAVRGR